MMMHDDDDTVQCDTKKDNDMALDAKVIESEVCTTPCPSVLDCIVT